MYNEALDTQIKRHKIHLLSNPISPYNTRLGVSPTRTEGKKIKFIFVGRLVYQKGIDRVLHIFKKNSNFELIIVGDGEEKEKLLAMTEKYGNKNNINFIGKKIYPFNLVAGADYFLLPSRWEGLPNCVLESLALGTPVISFKRIFALKDFKNNLKDNSLVLCEDEKTLEKYFFSLKRRKDYMKPKLRKSLLKNYITTQSFQKSINKIDGILISLINVKLNKDEVIFSDSIQSYIIIEPSWLMNVTELTQFDFYERSLFNKRFSTFKPNQYTLVGNIVHEVFDDIIENPYQELIAYPIHVFLEILLSLNHQILGLHQINFQLAYQQE